MDEPCYYRISVKGIVVDEQGRILLAREDNGKWELMGGGIEHGEAPHEALRREIIEETGLVITAISETPKYFVTSKRLNKTSYLANIIYEIELADLNFTPSEECQALQFFAPEEAKRLELFPNVKNFLDVFNPELHRE
jgi:8-oxo-dGTP diphosphatase